MALLGRRSNAQSNIAGRPNGQAATPNRGLTRRHGNRTPSSRQAGGLLNKVTLVLLVVGVVLGYILLPVLMVEMEEPMTTLPPYRPGTGSAYPQGGERPASVESPSHTEAQNHRMDLDTTGDRTEEEPVAPQEKPRVNTYRAVDYSWLDRITGTDDEEGAESIRVVEEQVRENNDVLASQSVPTRIMPHVMRTPRLPDHLRKKILVTGGAGFVGSHLVDKLMMEGHEVIVADNFFTGQMRNVAHWLQHPLFSLMKHDVTEPLTLEVDQIYHLACPASPPHYQYNPVKTIKTSTVGTLNMLGLAKRVKARILLTSTSEIYGDPEVHPQPESYWGNVNTIGPRACYDEGKRVAETMMYAYKNQNNVDVRVARIFNTFGPRMHPNDGRVVSNFIIQALQNKNLTIYGSGEQTRSFQYVSDLVDGLHALMNGDYDQPVNLGNPDEYTVKDFAGHIKQLTKSESEIVFFPKSEDDPQQRKPDITTAGERLGWKPVVQVQTGLERTIEYFQRVLKEAGEIVPTGPGAAKPKA